MDIARPSNLRQKRIRRAVYGTVGLTVVLLITLGVSRLKPAAPGVERATVWIDTVKRGPMLRDVRGHRHARARGHPLDSGHHAGRVERIVLRPGTVVTAGSVILELSNPQLEQELQDADAQAQGRRGEPHQPARPAPERRARPGGGTTASIEADYKKAALQVEVNEQLAAKGARLRHDAQAVEARRRAAVRAATPSPRSSSRATPSRCESRLAVQQSEVDQARAIVQLKQRQVDELHVRAGLAGVLQVVPVEVGQQVAPGTNLARVANPSRLKAELKIAGNAGQGHPDRAAGHHRHAQRHRRRHGRAHRSVGAERHGHGGRRAATARCRRARGPT